MALRTFVKVSHINNLSDARYCAGMYVNWLGFSLEESDENFLSPEKFKEITDWLSGVSYVAEFETTHPENILKKLEAYPGMEIVEISEEIHIPMLLNTGLSLVYRANINTSTDIWELSSKASGFQSNEVIILLESTLDEIDNDMIAEIHTLASQTKVILGFGLNPNNLDTILDKTGVYGIALKGGHEIKPGLKDFDELADILEVLEVED